jgi:signal transduction histidine kinase
MPAAPQTILLVEDNPADVDLIGEALADGSASGAGLASFALVPARRLTDGLARLTAGDIDVVLLDLSLPDSQGLDTFRRLHAAAPRLPIVVLSGLNDEDLAVRAMREGAQDYLVKGRADGELLTRTIRYAIERGRAEEERAARAAAEAALQARDELLGVISHDLRSPLTTVRGVAQLLIRQIAGGRTLAPEELAERLTSIEATTRRMGDLLDELLDATRLQAGHTLELNRAPTDLVALARRAIDERRASPSQHTICLTTAEPAVSGDWDAPRLARVLGNLLDNAIKYSPDRGDIVVTIALAAVEERQRWAVLSVQDHGIGIPPGDLPHVFERFFRGTNVAGRIRGTGIGLAGARQIVEQHGGTLTAESREGEGSTFTVRLPLND